MKKELRNNLLIIAGWFFVLLGAIGILLPIVPTTPFLIVALALFSKSSPRFHQMLLNNPLFGKTLQNWEETKTLHRRVKYKATILIIVTFTVSILLKNASIRIQAVLVCIALVLVFCIWRIKEPS